MRIPPLLLLLVVVAVLASVSETKEREEATVVGNEVKLHQDTTAQEGDDEDAEEDTEFDVSCLESKYCFISLLFDEILWNYREQEENYRIGGTLH